MPYMLQAARTAWHEVFPSLKRGAKASTVPQGLRLAGAAGRAAPPKRAARPRGRGRRKRSHE